jgi:LL-diaminopimelate aminotransferase
MRFSSARADQLPAYAVQRIATAKRRLLGEGRDVIDLGAGDADLPPPPVAVSSLATAARDPRNSRYAFQTGLLAFRESIAAYMQRRFAIAVDPVTEVLPLIGSKDGLAHLPLALLDPGDLCIIPEPGYTPYLGGTILAGAEPLVCPLRAQNDFLLDLEGIPDGQLKRARLVILNYPNNPTAAIAPWEYLVKVVEICRRHEIVLAYDNPYCEITFDGYRAPSILEIPGARDVAIEFHSLSKSFGMTGWRVGWAAGRSELIGSLLKVKQYVDTGPFLAIQHAAAVTLDAAETLLPHIRDTFRERRDAGVAALARIGITVEPPKATMYLWVPLTNGMPSWTFAERLLEEEYVAVLPGASLGAGGEGYIRIALTVNGARLDEAATRIGRFLQRRQGGS